MARSRPSPDTPTLNLRPCNQYTLEDRAVPRKSKRSQNVPKPRRAPAAVPATHISTQTLAALATLLALALLTSACDVAPASPTTDAGILIPDAGDALLTTCDVIPEELEVCATCHRHASTVDGWHLPNPTSAEPDNTWGRSAFFRLFTAAGSRTIPEHGTVSGWVEECFCLTPADEPWTCNPLPAPPSGTVPSEGVGDGADESDDSEPPGDDS